MNKAINELRLFLFTCSGEDNFILKRCSDKIQKRFALIGFFVLLIFAGCFFSATFFAYSLFEGAKWISFPMGIIWGAVVVNMYLLLLHTISPAIIPLSTKKKKKSSPDIIENKSILSFSMCLRLGFMVLLAIIIAQPLNVFTLSSSIQSSLEQHKIVERIKLYALTNKELIKNELSNQKEFTQKILERSNENMTAGSTDHIAIINTKIESDAIFLTTTENKVSELNKIDENLFLTDNAHLEKIKILNQLETLLYNELASDADFIFTINSTSINGSLKNDYLIYKDNLINLVTEKTDNYNELNDLLNKSNFYIKTIQLLLIENPVSWFFTFLVCLMFLLPIYFKYKIRDLSTKMFNKHKHSGLIRLREELISTQDFKWLEEKIKSIDINSVNTSDYYFQRMLIEHRIILEEYDETKKIFSKILTSNIILYNEKSLERLHPLLEKLKKVNLSEYHKFSERISEEYKNELMVKYEHWLDAPFRTKSRHPVLPISNNEQSLLEFLYNQES
jgi:hypothetical protein